MNKERYKSEIDLLQLAKMLLKNAKYIVLVTVIMGVLGFFGSKFLISPIYEANAKLIVNTRNDQSSAITNDQLNSAKSLVNAYAIIIRSRDVLNQVSAQLNLSESYEQLLSYISVRAVDDTQVMQVSVQHKDRATALAIAAKILEIAPDMGKKAVGVGSIRPVEQAYSLAEPISPSNVKNAVWMAMIGFMGACGMVAIVFLMDNTYKTDMDIQNDLDLPVLGVIPTVESCGGHKKYKYGYYKQEHSAQGGE